MISVRWRRFCRKEGFRRHVRRVVGVLNFIFLLFLKRIDFVYLVGTNLIAWKVPFDVRMISILYSGIIGSAFGVMIHTWGLHVKGPFYVASFRPLSIVIAAIFGVIFLHDYLFLGSVVGSMVISLGFYSVLWGKMKEAANNVSDNYDVESFDNTVDDAPLLSTVK